MYCRKCGKEISEDLAYCPHCGAATKKAEENPEVVVVSQKDASSNCSRGLSMILACLGFFVVSGIHRFYVGKIGTGILWLLTAGCFGIGTLVDIIMIATGTFTDSEGRPLLDWTIN